MRIEKQKCPHCGYLLDEADGLTDPKAKPSPGDITLCVNCGEVCVFDDDMKLRVPTIDEYIKIGRDPNMTRAREAWKAMDEERRNPRPKKQERIGVIESGWQKLLSSGTVLRNSSPDNLKVLRASFYSGAAWLFTQLIEKTDNSTEEMTPQDVSLMDGIATEIKDFAVNEKFGLGKK
jgi:hypothetical protein